MSLQPTPHLSFDDCLAGERASPDERCEYIGGEVYPMSGGTFEHNTIISNLVGRLFMQTVDRPCQVFGAGQRLRVQAADAGKYADLTAFFGEPDQGGAPAARKDCGGTTLIRLAAQGEWAQFGAIGRPLGRLRQQTLTPSGPARTAEPAANSTGNHTRERRKQVDMFRTA